MLVSVEFFRDVDEENSRKVSYSEVRKARRAQKETVLAEDGQPLRVERLARWFAIVRAPPPLLLQGEMSQAGEPRVRLL